MDGADAIVIRADTKVLAAEKPRAIVEFECAYCTLAKNCVFPVLAFKSAKVPLAQKLQKPEPEILHGAF
jgi:hypothetical protein